MLHSNIIVLKEQCHQRGQQMNGRGGPVSSLTKFMTKFVNHFYLCQLFSWPFFTLGPLLFLFKSVIWLDLGLFLSLPWLFQRNRWSSQLLKEKTCGTSGNNWILQLLIVHSKGNQPWLEQRFCILLQYIIVKYINIFFLAVFTRLR